MVAGQNTFDWLDFNLAIESDRSSQNRIAIVELPGHPLRRPRRPSSSRLTGHPDQLATFDALRLPPSEDGLTLRAPLAARCLSPISATNLLSLAPAGSPGSRTNGSRRPDLRFWPCALDSAHTEDDTELFTAALVYRKRFASFEQEHSWAVLPAGTIPALPFTGCSAFPSVTLADLLSRARAESTWPLTPPVAPLSSPEQHRVHRREPELFPPVTRQRGRLPKLEAPFPDRSRSPCPSPKRWTRIPEPPLVPLLCRFGPASHLRSRAAVAR